jgi:predicted amino acid-binding ACT domain protein
MPTQPESRYVISVLVPDRVGILRDLTSAVTDLGANIEGISQTVVQGYFTVIMIAAFAGPVAEEALTRAIGGRFAPGEAGVVLRPYAPPEHPPEEGERYFLTMAGRDRPGILKTLTAYLAEKKINVEDLYFRISGRQVTHIGEVTVPRLLDIKQIQDELRELMRPLGLEVSLQHENLFRVTNEVGSIRTIMEGGA